MFYSLTNNEMRFYYSAWFGVVQIRFGIVQITNSIRYCTHNIY